MAPAILGVTAGLSLAMMLAWAAQRRLGNAGWVDVVWTFAVGAAGVAYASWPAPGSVPMRRAIVGIAAAVWAIRLGRHLVLRTRHGEEDVRYAQFRKDWGAAYERKMFGFLQIQAAAAAFLAAAMLLAARNPRPLGLLDAMGVAVIGVAIAGEAMADGELRRFRADPANRRKICDAGLWSRSRHPNYFFEWLGWLAYPLFAIGLDTTYPQGWLAFAAPAFMYWLLVHVSGIPPLEQQMLQSRGDAYRAYQARTRAFLPLAKRA